LPVLQALKYGTRIVQYLLEKPCRQLQIDLLNAPHMSVSRWSDWISYAIQDNVAHR